MEEITKEQNDKLCKRKAKNEDDYAQLLLELLGDMYLNKPEDKI